MSLAILFHFLCAQHVSDINIYISSGARDYSVQLPHWSFCFVKTEDLALASDIKLVFNSSTITMMHGPINIR